MKELRVSVEIWKFHRELLSVVSRVPQVVPLLFLVYIDDVSQIFSNGSLLLYADDIVLYHPILLSGGLQLSSE